MAELNGDVEDLRRGINRARDKIRQHSQLDPLVSDFKRSATYLGAYWSANHEMFARAFEAYTRDKLVKAGRMNTYLVGDDRVTKKYVTDKLLPNGSYAQPYPHDEEREKIVEAMDQLMATLRESGHLEKAMGRLFQPLQRFVIRGEMPG
jgi:hypothetical protein